ncbi:hypothetical protein [Gilvimarinus sp. 1_MG-2023]|nr:hypothetical protein [Gilvimarinus sp. 1_MG-2023]MDO6748534.1 hypothetical protein [Gilvimarinus sp. 1_MG-2023]
MKKNVMETKKGKFELTVTGIYKEKIKTGISTPIDIELAREEI